MSPSRHTDGRHRRAASNGVDDHVGAKLRALRETRGWSQQTLADRCGISFQQIQKYENGANRMGASRLHQFAEIFDVAVETFFEGLPSNKHDSESATADLSSFAAFARSAEGRSLVTAFMTLDAAKRRQTLQLIRTLASPPN